MQCFYRPEPNPSPPSGTSDWDTDYIVVCRWFELGASDTYPPSGWYVSHAEAQAAAREMCLTDT